MTLKTDFISVAVMGLVGVASLAIAPLETLLPPMAGEIPRGYLLIQPAVLIIFFAMLGSWAAPKLGLGLINSDAAKANANSTLLIGWCVAASAVCAIILILYARFYAALAPNLQSIDAQKLATFQLPIVTKILYGGMGEEVICRWGLMSALALVFGKLGLERSGALWIGNSAAALLFALGHLPLLFLLLPDASAQILQVVLLGNFVVGLIFGALFMRFGLIAAMLAHAGAHLFSTIGLMMMA